MPTEPEAIRHVAYNTHYLMLRPLLVVEIQDKHGWWMPCAAEPIGNIFVGQPQQET